MDRILTSLARWLVFTVLLSLVPIGFSALQLLSRGIDLSLRESLHEVLGRGDLLLIAAILCGGATGELFASGTSYRMLRIIAAGGAILILTFSAMLFGDLAAAQLSGQAVDSLHIERMSTWFFGAAVVSGASCIALGGMP